MKLKKIISLAAASSMAVTMLGGCGTTKEETKKDITLKYLMLGPAGQEDQQMVFTEFNKRLQEKLPGVKVDFEVADGADYQQRFMLIQAGGEQLDIVGTYGIDFNNEVSNDSFMALDDLLDEYGKETKAALPDWLFDYMTVNGKIYGIPAYQQLSTPFGIYMPKEYAEKYMNFDEFKAAVQSQDFEKVYQITDSYAEALKNDGKLGCGIDIADVVYMTKEFINTQFAAEKTGDKQYNVDYFWFEDAEKEYYKWAHEWYQKGYIRKDVMTETDKDSKIFNNDGGYAMFINQVNPMMDEKHKDYVSVPFSDRYTIPAKSAAGGVAIMSGCEHPEEAMQVLNILHTDKEMYNLLTYGIEGTHYKKVDDNTIEVPYDSTQGGTNDKYGLYRWIIGNTELSYNTQLDSEEMNKWIFETVNKAEDKSDFIGFVLDTSSFQDNIDQLTAIKDQYKKSLMYGTLDDWEAKLDEWEKKAEASELNMVKEEMQKQVDEFLKNK